MDELSPISYTFDRICDYLRREQPLLYLQAMGCDFIPSIWDVASLGSYWLRLYWDGNRHRIIVVTARSAEPVLNTTRDLTRYIDDEVVFNHFLPMLEASLVLEDLASI